MSLIASEVRRVSSACGLLAAALLLASCGGGTTNNSFVPTRIIAFGDETSVIDDFQGDGNGRKYSINATVSATDPTLDCQSNPIWIQTLATNYGHLVFPQCNPGPTPVDNPPSRIRATFGAMAADLSTQIDAQLAESAFHDGDLVTVLVGVNDVLAQYAQYPDLSEATLTANLAAAGALAGSQVNRLADAGAKVIVTTIPDIGYSPFAVAERTAHIDTDRQQLLIRLVSRYNASLRSSLTNDGHRIGLVTMDQLVESVAGFSGLNGFIDSADPACDLSQSLLSPPSILDCTDFTLVPNATPTNYLWADDRHLSFGGQLSLGNLALQRAQSNPF
ncbi:MAG: SGNH/GDSL hydrolase family protein [Pseudomonadota bacterium]|nr:SGNH/GDSL hydrolase family protein [Pseudomonadota bacterium]